MENWNTISKILVDAGAAVGVLLLVVVLIKQLTNFVKSIKQPLLAAPLNGPKIPRCVDSPGMVIHMEKSEQILSNTKKALDNHDQIIRGMEKLALLNQQQLDELRKLVRIEEHRG